MEIICNNMEQTTIINGRVIMREQKKECDFQRMLDLWQEHCPMCEQPIALTDADKRKIEVQFKEMDYDYDRLSYIMQIIGKSGERRKFRWLLNRNANWRKVEIGEL